MEQECCRELAAVERVAVRSMTLVCTLMGVLLVFMTTVGWMNS